MVLVVLTLAIPTGLTVLLLWACRLVNSWLALAVESLLSYQLLATKSLAAESRKVYDALKTGDLDKARYAVSMIVGRDTASLDEAGVAVPRWRQWRRTPPTGSSPPSFSW